MASPQSTLPNDEKEAQDRAYNPGEQHARELAGNHDTLPGYDRSNDGLDDHPVSGGDTSGVEPQDSAAGVRKAEQNPNDADFSGGFYKPSANSKKGKTSQKNVFIKRGGIIGFILTLLVGGGIAGVTLLSPAGLFLQLGNVFTNAYDDSSSALSIRANKLLKIKVDGLKNAFDQSSEGKCNAKCKFSTVGETMKNNLESPTNKFQATFSEKKFGGRYTIESITFPDGTKVTDGASFAAATKDAGRARALNNIFNSKIKFFLNGSPFAQSLKIKLGLDRLPKIFGSSKEEIDTSLRKAVGATGDSAATDGTAAKKTTITEKLSGKIGAKVSKASDLVGAACLAYDVTKISVAVTKVTKMASYAAFAISFLAVKDQIMAGDADPNVVSALGSQLTDAGSATDAPIYKQAANGDVITDNSGFSINPSTALVSTLAGIGGVIGVNAVARNSAHAVCKTAGNPAAQVAICLPEIVAGLGAAGVGAIAAAVGCIGINVIGGVLAGAAIGAAIPLIIDTIVKSDYKIPDETTRGTSAGQVIGLGTEAILGGKSQTYAMTAATSASDIVAYNKATLDDKNQQKAIARLDASEDPFNINNEFTFVGSLASKLDLASYSNASLFGAITKTLGIVPMSFAHMSSSIYADSGYPLGYDKSTVYKAGNSAALDSIGVLSNDSGFPTYVMSDAELSMSIFTATDNLVASHDLNEDGTVIANSDYAKYKQYCGIDRVDPLGETTMSISDDDYEWGIGAKCVEKSSHMSDIRVYSMDSDINGTMEGEFTSDVVTTTPVSNKAVQPLDPGYSTSDGFGPRVSPCSGCSSYHPAVDLTNYPGGSLGRPVYAIMDGEVIAVDRSGGNDPVSIKHTNGTVSQYLHMYVKDIVVNVGDKVTAGQQIGKIGNSGDSTGAHLDLRIYIDGVDLTKETAIADIVKDSKNTITASGHIYINPVLYLALFGVVIA